VTLQRDTLLAGTPRIRPRKRWRWVALPAIVLALAVGAFLYWGPVGLGNGPLFVTFRGAEATAISHPGPIGTIVPIFTAGPGPAVVDGVDVVGGTRYPSPRVLATGMLTTSSDCNVAVMAAQPAVTGPGFTLSGCGSYRGPLAGHAFRPSHRSTGMTAAAELTAPERGTCSAMTRLVVHYHVGSKHFSGSYQFQLAACLGVDSAGVEAAMKAAYGSP
jgi:hypothetical protein